MTHINDTATLLNKAEKLCKTCGEVKELTDFSIQGRRKDGSAMYRSDCKPCKVLTDRLRNIEKLGLDAYRQSQRDRVNLYGKTRRKEACERARLYWQNNKDKKKKYMKGYIEDNRDAINAYNAKKAIKRKVDQTSIADPEAVKAFYTHAKLMTKYTGIQYQVDHMDPLTHPLVCGLHNERNLRVVTAVDNHVKKNKFTPYSIDKDGFKLFLKTYTNA